MYVKILIDSQVFSSIKNSDWFCLLDTSIDEKILFLENKLVKDRLSQIGVLIHDFK